MQEQIILANAVASRQCYDIVEAVGYTQHLTDTGHALWSLVQEWYDRDAKATQCNLEVLAERVSQKYPNHEKELHYILGALPDLASPANFANVLAEGRRQVLREEMIMALADKKDEAAWEAWREFGELDDLEAGEDDTLVGTDPRELVDQIVNGECIPLAPEGLNEHLRGGLLLGSHALLFGRTELGKSLLALNCLASAATAKFRSGFWENEDSIIATQLRGAQALTGATEDELMTPSRRVERLLKVRGWYDRVFFKDSPAGSLAEIRAWIKAKDLQFCVINQLANLQVRHADNRVLELGELAKGARSIAKETGCAILSIHQAGDTASNKKVLTMSDLHWSKTDIQSAIDVLLGFGADEDMVARDKRIISICKNKRGGGHARVPLRVDLTRNKVY
jgi:hypothetical protein